MKRIENLQIVFFGSLIIFQIHLLYMQHVRSLIPTTLVIIFLEMGALKTFQLLTHGKNAERCVTTSKVVPIGLGLETKSVILLSLTLNVFWRHQVTEKNTLMAQYPGIKTVQLRVSLLFVSLITMSLSEFFLLILEYSFNNH